LDVYLKDQSPTIGATCKYSAQTFTKPVLMNRAVPRGDSDVPGRAEGTLIPGTSKQPAYAWVARKAPRALAATIPMITLNVIFIAVLPMAFKVYA
jgi:hypothetical protein